jgi:glycerophosphoryl diester phosphodiesterase
VGHTPVTPDHARLEIYDVHGALVRRLVDADLPAGAHRVFWRGEDRDGGNVSSGVYFYVLDTGGHRYSRKMVLTR